MRLRISAMGKLVGAGSMCLLPLALSVNLAMAQKAQPLSLACNTTVTSGSGDGYMAICISANGNVAHFEGSKGTNHIYADGYMLGTISNCAGPYDIGTREAGWAAPNPRVPPGATLPLTITRSTTDGKFKLVQKFTRNPTERELTIQMTLSNTSSQAQTIWSFTRFVDFDANNSPANDVIDKTMRSVNVHEYNSNSGAGFPFHGAMATILLPTGLPVPIVYSLRHPIPSPNECPAEGTGLSTPYVSSGADDDIYSMLVFRFPGSMAKGTSKVMTVKYQIY